MSVLSRPHPIVISTRTLVTILLALLLALPLLPAKGVTAQDNAAPLDLPAMALQPADFTAEGRDDYGQSFGYLADRPRKIAGFVESLELDAGNPDGEILAGAGAERSYVLQLGRLHTPMSDLAL